MINFRLEKGKFNYRIAGILQRDGKFLFHKEQHSVHWSLPGGRAELLEDSKATLVREFQEELNVEIIIKNLQFVVENFFVYRETDYHELGLIYQVELKNGDIPNNTFTIEEEGVTYLFKWFNSSELQTTSIMPDFLKTALSTPLPTDTQHFIQR